LSQLCAPQRRTRTSTRWRWLALSALSLSCDLGGEAQHRGEYGFLPGASVPATAPRPLNRLLIIEADGAANRTLFYLFSGELGAAGIGLEDLRVLSRRFARYEMHFDPAPESYAAESAGAGGSSGDGDETPVPGLALRIDAETVSLAPLAAAALRATGAARFVPSLDGSAGPVLVHFGIWPSARAFDQLHVDSPAGPLDYSAELAPAELSVRRAEAELVFSYGTLETPDYLQLDLFQRLIRLSDQAELEAALGISLPPELAHAAHFDVISSAYSQGCWSSEQPVSARLTQVARDYTVLDDGDAAVVFRRLDRIELEPELFRDAVEAGAPPAYCSGFRP
jgi:hypothetical protein